MRQVLSVGLLLVTIVVASCGGDTSTDRWAELGAGFEEVSLPIEQRSGQPRLVAAGDSLVLSWVERTDDGAELKFAVRNADAWSDAISAASGDDWFVNWADTPGVIPIGTGAYAAFYLQRTGPQPYQYAIRVVFSHDAGLSWSQPHTPHAEHVQAEFGFVSALPEEGGVRLVWLDGEDTQNGHDDGHGDMVLRTAVLADDGTTAHDEIVDDRVCECCPTAAVRTSAGLTIAYRDRSDSEIRDVGIAVLRDGAAPQRVIPHVDDWEIAGCPVNGPSLATDGERVSLVWFTGVSGGEVRAAFSSDGGVKWDVEALTVDADRPEGRVSTAMLPAGDVLISWIAREGDGGQLRIARVGDDVRQPVDVTGIDLGRSSGIPRIAISDGSVWIAWVDTNERGRVRLARTSLDRFD